MPPTRRILIVALYTLVTTVGLTAADQIDGAAESKDRQPTATWLFRTDLECRWSIDGEAKGLLRVDDRVRVTLGVGEHLIEAVPLSGGPRWEQVITVGEPKAQVFTIPLLTSVKEAITKARAEEKAEERRNLRADTEKRGYWIDPETGLMWAAEASGIVNWYDARKYCKQLRVGAYRDWRLPVVEEVERIRDAGPPPDAKGGILVPGLLWTDTQGQTRREALAFNIRIGEADAKDLDYDGGRLNASVLAQGAKINTSSSLLFTTHALCVRR